MHMIGASGGQTPKTEKQIIREAPRIKAVIEGEAVFITLDSGSSITAISQHLFNIITSRNKNVQTLPVVATYCTLAVGRARQKINKQMLLRMMIDGNILEVVCFVIPNLAAEVILGSDILYALKAVIDFREKHVKLCEGSRCLTIKFAGQEHAESVELTEVEEEILEGDFFIELIQLEGHEEKIIKLSPTSGSIVAEDTWVPDGNAQGGGNYVNMYGLSSEDVIYLEEGTIPSPPSSTNVSIEARLREKVNHCYPLNPQQREALWEILMKNKDVFSDKIGKCANYRYSYEVIDPKPFRYKCRIIPLELRDAVDETIKNLLDQGIIKPINSAFVNPLCIIKKSSGKVRITLDSRNMNQYIVRDNFRTQPIEQILAGIGSKKFFSSLDVTNSYLQIEVAPHLHQYSSFLYKGRNYCFTRASYGQVNSGSAFLRAMHQILGTQTEKFISQYVDDLLIHDNNIEDHLMHLDIVLSKIRENNMTLNWDKCQFFETKIKFVGYVISEGTISPDPERVEAILKIPRPRNQRQVKKLLGIFGYQARFLVNFAREAAPLHALLKKGEKWKWTEVEEEAFERMKGLFSKSVLLTCPDETQPFLLFSDASQLAYGGLLAQRAGTGELRVIATASRALTAAEKVACITQQEISAVFFCLQKFRHYVYNRELIIYTDHLSLSFMSKCKLTSNKISRYIQEVMAYNPTMISHIPGAQNIFSDVLSRIQHGQDLPETVDSNHREIRIWKLDLSLNAQLVKQMKKIADYQAKDRKLMKLITLAPPVGSANEAKYGMHEGVLYKKDVRGRGAWRVYIPPALEELVIESFHKALIHGGVERTVAAISEHFYVYKLGRRARELIAACDLCQKAKSVNYKVDREPKAMLRERPGQLAFADAHGPMPTARTGLKFIFVVMDCMSKVTALFPMKKLTSANCARKITHDYTAAFGKPEAIVVDNASIHHGRKFTSELEKAGIRIINISRYHPNANMCERRMRDLSVYLRVLTHEKHSRWSEYLHYIQWVMNNSINSSTGYAPLTLHLNRSADPLIADLPRHIPIITETDAERIEEAFKRLSARAEKRMKRKKRYARTWQPKENDRVLLKNFKLSNAALGRTKKMELVYHGPVVIDRVIGDRTYVLRNGRTGKVLGKHSLESIRPYVTRKKNGESCE